MEMEASPSCSDSFSRGWLRCKARPAAFDRLDADADAGLGHSFGSSLSFIDMDPEELFSMRWTSAAKEEEYEEDAEFDFGLPCAGEQGSSPLLVGAGRFLLLPRELPGSAVRDGSTACADASPGSSPAFHSAQSTPASVASSRRVAGGAKTSAEAPLLATRKILLRYLRFLAPLCRKARALPLRMFAPRSTQARAPAATTTSSSPARQSTSSYASAAECWCHGNADTAVRDAILYCKKSIQGQDM